MHPTVSFKKVPAVEKCFAILDLLSRGQKPLGVSEITSGLGLNKSTVFNLVHTLCDLGILTNGDGKFRFGTGLYMLAKIANENTSQIQTIHPFLEEISSETGLSVFLGMLSDDVAVIIDKVTSNIGMRISTDIGTKIPITAGAGGKVLLSQLPVEEVVKLATRARLTAYTRNTCIDPKLFIEVISEVKREGVAFDREDYIENIRAVSVPIDVNKKDLKLAVWTVGLASQLPEEKLLSLAELMKNTARRIEARF